MVEFQARSAQVSSGRAGLGAARSRAVLRLQTELHAAGNDRVLRPANLDRIGRILRQLGRESAGPRGFSLAAVWDWRPALILSRVNIHLLRPPNHAHCRPSSTDVSLTCSLAPFETSHTNAMK